MLDTNKYNTEINEKWNGKWAEEGLFLFDEKDEKKELYVIDTPPPFTTGELHIGQAFWVCYVDAVARYKRMKGFNVLYPQGWDSQGFPIEIVVEKSFGKGMAREEFYSKCAEIATKNIARMKAQMLKLGASFDGRHEYITMSEEYRRKVQLSLLMMHEKGFIYRDKHPVEWCVHCEASIAREETVEREEDTKLNYLKFSLSRGKRHLEIATTRPEYLHACVAIAVNPSDERYKDIIGSKVKVPLFEKSVEVIADENIDKEYGTGAEMVCTFGDKNDRLLFYRHNLALVEAIDEKGNLQNSGEFDGKSTKEGRALIIERLKSEGYLIKQEDVRHTVKTHDRCKTPIEIRSAMQWFIKTKDHAGKIKEKASEMEWIPEYTLQRLVDWANFIEWDWNISRKRIFGTPIPFWYCGKCNQIIAPKKEELPVNPATAGAKACPKCGGKAEGETDTCDVWVDSSITPLVIAGWPDDKRMVERAFPASLRIQGTDIIRTWAFYTTFRTWALTGNKPFESLLVHGMIQGSDGKEMHKSEGNGISPEELIGKYPVDAIRLWVAMSGGIGKDRPFSHNEIDYAKNFMNKLYNSALFVSKAAESIKVPKEEPHKHLGIFDIWILNRLNAVAKEVGESYDSLNLNDAMNKMINFYWHEFADYYMENVKHRVYSQDEKMAQSAKAAAYTLKHVLMESVKMMAPVMPYVAEEINGMFDGTSVFRKGFPAHVEKEDPSAYVINGVIFKSGIVEVDYEETGALLNKVISDVRKAKAGGRLALNKEIASININVPEEYYKAVEFAKGEIGQICKAGSVNVEKGAFSVSVNL